MSLVGHWDHRKTPLDCFMANWKTIRLTFYGFFAEYSFERADVTKDFYLQLADTFMEKKVYVTQKEVSNSKNKV